MIYRVDIDEDKPTRYFSSKQEKALAKKLKSTNAKVQPNSGATLFKKGDVVDDNWLFECKTTTKKRKSFSIKEEWFLKNSTEKVITQKEYSALVFSYGPDEPNYYVLDENTFLIMKDLLDSQQED